MLSLIRKQYEAFFSPLGKFCKKVGFTPNILTVFSVISGMAAGYLIWKSHFIYGIILLLVSVLFDVADGSTARALGKKSSAGEVYDHIGDRYVEFFILVGIALNDAVASYWIIFCVFGMTMASYIRAKAEAVDPEGYYKYGIAERQEKITIIIFGLLIHQFYPNVNALTYALIIVGVLSHLTVIQRLYVVRKREKKLD